MTTMDTASVTLAAGKSKTVISQIVLSRDKKLKKHTTAIRYESTIESIATRTARERLRQNQRELLYVRLCTEWCV